MGADDAVVRFTERVTEEFPDAEVFLFGSRARGEYLAGSEYDIVVLSDGFEGLSGPRCRERVYRYWDGDHPVDILTYTFAEFERYSEQVTIAREARNDMVAV